MTFEPVDLNLTDPTKGYLNFVLYTEARLGIAATSLNADLSIEAPQTQTPHFQEWLSRLVRCEPNAMHCTLVEQTKIPALFHPCVTEDKNSPSAISGSGCVCRQTFYDPEFGLPVVAEHFKHVGEGGTDQWTYQTYAPLDLRPDDTFSRFITGRGLFWARTEKGLLSILPQREALGYNIGYSGGGPHALAAYLTQVADTDGQNTAAGPRYEKAHPAIVAWTQSSAADRGTNELTLSDLKAMLQS
ncbi:hypothetical protein [Streptomyces colonosanans]|uniref:Uncharacterized protein n=1 Tax=Streptomyces colonosanans TaxID=1428652 RepID=A0A1S2PNZ0_9ACTN|nr:hypothetical protein [Streptomyces colonosanans]OIJ95443.1 hypothetical protein BIV24_09190 [Streptomyces colonosanans]